MLSNSNFKTGLGYKIVRMTIAHPQESNREIAEHGKAKNFDKMSIFPGV